jgi:hypothetical protein
MKKLLFALILLGFTQALTAQNDAISKYFDQYKDDTRFTMVSVSPKMFQMIANIASEEIDDKEVLDMIKEMQGLKILKTEINALEFYKEALAKINTKEYEEFMTVRDEGQNIKFLVKDQDGGNIVNELLLIVGGKDEFVMLSFIGKIQLNKIAKLAKNMDIDGMEHLDKLDKED